MLSSNAWGLGRACEGNQQELVFRARSGERARESHPSTQLTTHQNSVNPTSVRRWLKTMLMGTNQGPRQASLTHSKTIRVLIEAVSHAVPCTKEGVISMDEHGPALLGVQVSH